MCLMINGLQHFAEPNQWPAEPISNEESPQGTIYGCKPATPDNSRVAHQERWPGLRLGNLGGRRGTRHEQCSSHFSVALINTLTERT